MKYARGLLVAVSCLLFLYLILFTDASFSGNALVWIALVVISAAVFGWDYYRMRQRNQQR